MTFGHFPETDTDQDVCAMCHKPFPKDKMACFHSYRSLVTRSLYINDKALRTQNRTVVSLRWSTMFVMQSSPPISDIPVCAAQCSGWFRTEVLFYFLVFQDRVSMCSPGYSATHSVDRAGLELRNPPASASQVQGLQARATMPGY